jgi:FixJ family two-component response regulator
MSDVAPIVLVIDDDVSVRESLESLTRCEVLQPEAFPSAHEFLYERVPVSNRLMPDVSLPGRDRVKRMQTGLSCRTSPAYPIRRRTA